MRDCGCDDCRRRREEAAEAAFTDAVVFAVYWHELHDGFPWESHDRVEAPIHDGGHDSDHDRHDDDHDDGFDADGFDDGFDDLDGW